MITLVDVINLHREFQTKAEIVKMVDTKLKGIYIHVDVLMCSCVSMYVHVYVYVCTYVYMYVHICMCVHIIMEI